MAGGSLERCFSLPDMSAADVCGRGDRDAAVMAITRSTGNLPRSDTSCSLEQGIDLLIAGSPIGESVTYDTGILDYDSDDTNVAAPSALVASEQQSPAMDTSNSCNDTVTRTSATSPSLSAVYYQCRSSRQSSFRETLISVSADGTFGKKVVSNPPMYGSFEDHNGIGNTFHGSRILKGITPVNQNVSM